MATCPDAPDRTGAAAAFCPLPTPPCSRSRPRSQPARDGTGGLCAHGAAIRTVSTEPAPSRVGDGVATVGNSPCPSLDCKGPACRIRRRTLTRNCRDRRRHGTTRFRHMENGRGAPDDAVPGSYRRKASPCRATGNSRPQCSISPPPPPDTEASNTPASSPNAPTQPRSRLCVSDRPWGEVDDHDGGSDSGAPDRGKRVPEPLRLEAARPPGRHFGIAAENKKAPKPPLSSGVRVGCGGRIRTCDLQVMSLTSYRTAPPRVDIVSRSGRRRGLEDLAATYSPTP